MHCFSKSLIVIRRYHHFTYRAANYCCQSLRDSRIIYEHDFKRQYKYIGVLWL